VKKNYQVISRQDRRALAQWLTKNGQGLLPLVELVEGAEIALEEVELPRFSRRCRAW